MASCTVRFISDLHFGHKWMANFRGFQDEFYHDEFIVEEWNKVVKSPKDLTFILGDITMEKKFWYYQLDRLMGRKIVVGGNHDDYRDTIELLKYVESIAGIIEYKGFLLTHCPVHPMELHERLRGNIHGHIHEKLVGDNKYFNVCPEQIGYAPITIDDLLKKYLHETT